MDVYGEGGLRQGLLQDIDRHGLKVRLMGLRDNLHEILPRYDMFVMSSLFEGQPVALLGVMACGLPSLLSNIPVLREVGGETALSFNLEEPFDLVKKMEGMKPSARPVLMSVGECRFASGHSRKSAYTAKLKSLYSPQTTLPLINLSNLSALRKTAKGI